MATIKLTMKLTDGTVAYATTRADYPTGDAEVKYEGTWKQLPPEITRAKYWPSLLQYFWKEHAEKSGATLDIKIDGEWLPEDDLK